MDEYKHNNTLDDAIDAVLSGERSVDDYEAYLRDELQVALLVHRLKSPAMSAASVNKLENQLRQQMPRRIFRLPVLNRTAAVVLMVVVIALAGSGGAVVASADANPNDLLYGIKRLWEGVVTLLYNVTGVPEDWSLHLAETRLEEVRALAAEGTLTESALDDLHSATQKVVEESDVNEDVLRFLHETESVLVVVDDEASEPIREVIAPVIIPTSMPSATITWTPTLIDTPTWTATVTITATTTFTATRTSTATATITPRFAPTVTRTPTRTPTVLPTETPIPTATATWTPLPTPTPGAFATALTATTAASELPLVGTMEGMATPAPTLEIRTFTPDPERTWYPWMQATFDAEYALRTAIAQTEQAP